MRLFLRIRGLPKFLALLIIPIITSSCATSGINKGQFNLYSVGYEKSIGQRISKEVGKECKILRITALQEYLDHIGQKLAQNVGEGPFSYSFSIIDEDEINAFALPGGYIFVYRGLLEAVENEAQLAAVLAHEMGHVEARHATERMSKIQGFNFLLDIVSITFGVPLYSGLAGGAVQLGEILAILKYSRDQEKEADLLGADFMTRAGYEPKGMPDFLTKLQDIDKRKPGIISRIFMTHPVTEKRIKTVERWTEEHAPLVEAEERRLTSPKFGIMSELITKE